MSKGGFGLNLWKGVEEERGSFRPERGNRIQEMTTQDAPKQNGHFRGLLGSKVPFNPAVHSMGPSPMMHDHIAAAMQRPWSQATPTKPKAPFNGAALVDHDVNISPQQSGSGPTSPTKVFMATGSESNHRMEGGGRPAFTNVPIQAAGPVPGKENSRRGDIKQEEGPWWDILPKLLGGPFCAIDQFGCCNGNHNSEASLTRRKPLCGIGIVFTEANHGALVVQQVVQG